LPHYVFGKLFSAELDKFKYGIKPNAI